MPPRGSVEDLGVELAFQCQNAGGKRGLGNGASQGCPPEMARFGECYEVTKLLRTGEDRHRTEMLNRAGAFKCRPKARPVSR